VKFKKYLKRKQLLESFYTKQQYSYTMGVDGITTNKFAEIIDDEITIIQRKVKNRSYKFSPYKEKLILKGRDSKPRMISIPTNRDILVLSALQKYLADSFRGKLFDRTVHKQISLIKKRIKSGQYDMFLKLDVKNFYPTLDHDILIESVKKG